MSGNLYRYRTWAGLISPWNTVVGPGFVQKLFPKIVYKSVHPYRICPGTGISTYFFQISIEVFKDIVPSYIFYLVTQASLPQNLTASRIPLLLNSLQVGTASSSLLNLFPLWADRPSWRPQKSQAQPPCVVAFSAVWRIWAGQMQSRLPIELRSLRVTVIFFEAQIKINCKKKFTPYCQKSQYVNIKFFVLVSRFQLKQTVRPSLFISFH